MLAFHAVRGDGSIVDDCFQVLDSLLSVYVDEVVGGGVVLGRLQERLAGQLLLNSDVIVDDKKIFEYVVLDLALLCHLLIEFLQLVVRYVDQALQQLIALDERALTSHRSSRRYVAPARGTWRRQARLSEPLERPTLHNHIVLSLLEEQLGRVISDNAG